MMTPSAFFFTIVEFGVPAFFRVVWYGVDLSDDACAPPTNSDHRAEREETDDGECGAALEEG